MIPQRLRSLAVKLSLSFLGLALLFSGIQFTALYQFWKTAVFEVRQRTYWDLAENLAEEIRPLLEQYKIEHPKVKEMLYRFEKRHPGEDVMLINEDGYLLTTRSELRVTTRERINAFLTSNPKRSLPLYAHDWNDNPTIFSVAPVRIKGKPAYLFVDLFGGSSDATSAGIGDRIMFFGGFVVSVIVALVVTVLGLSVILLATKRLRKLIDVVGRYSAGELDARSPVTGNDEVALLGMEFNRMADAISANLEALKRNDEERRELIAQISHDLGTPITSAQTSLEALCDPSTTLESAIQEERLAGALRSVSRVRRLCSDLLELSKMELAAVQPNPETLDVLELLSEEIIPRLTSFASDHSATLSLHSSQQEMYVRTDIGLLERVLSNLIENAIRYSESEVRIEVSPAQDPNYCDVRIQDSGTGISEKELTLLTKQFYRSESAREKNPHGSGIGLATVRKLLLVQGLELSIQSSEGEGSCFSFRLPLDCSDEMKELS